MTIAAHKLAAFGRFGESALTHEVRHLDGNPGNNRVGNLAVGTHSENMMDIPPDVRREKAIHAAASLRKHSDEVVASVRADRASGHTYDIIGRTYGLSKSTISYILNRAAY